MSKKLILSVVVIMAMSLIGTSVVFAQDATQATPGTAVAQICPNGGPGTGPADGTGNGPGGGAGGYGPADGTGNGPGGGTANLEQRLERHEAMTANVPPEMQERHAAMGDALRSGDTAKVQELRDQNRAACQSQRDAQQ